MGIQIGLVWPSSFSYLVNVSIGHMQCEPKRNALSVNCEKCEQFWQLFTPVVGCVRPCEHKKTNSKYLFENSESKNHLEYK